MINEALLRELAPRPRRSATRQRIWDGYVAAMVSPEAAELFQKFGITNELRMAHLLANWCAETGGFQIMYESGAYSARRIMEIFGVGRHSAAVTWSEAKRLAYNGPALFDRVYGVGNARKVRELGNDEPGDGWRYRGVGIVQITGKRDHVRYAAKIGVPTKDLAVPIHSIHAALLEWDNKDCNKWADRDDTRRVRRLINGGYNGLAHVRTYLAKAKKLLRAAPIDDQILELGDDGPKVVWLQDLLKSHGYPLGASDGVFGTMTERALVSWQLQNEFDPTGRFDLKDDETTAALEQVPAPDPQVPERDIAKEDLKERGSRTVKEASWWERIWGWLFGGAAAAAVDTQANLGAVDSVISQGERVTGLVDRTTGLVSWMPDWRALALFGFCLLAFVMWRAFRKIQQHRVEDAQTGNHLGR